MITRTTLIATGAVLVALGLTACGSDDAADTPATSTASSTVADATTSANTAAAAAAPGAETLNATLATFFDPAVPAADKVVLIEDGEKQAAVLEQFNGVLQGYPLTADVTKVVAVDDDTVTATTTIAGPHGGAPVEVTFDEHDGAWIISDDAVCTILGMGQLTCVK
ncbi:nuclear transport factor 2 family protein [Rhodococcus sp. NPDC058505]|uniref:nuclear transport factor 2 family protein n=1 Tax=Rhodococcus sp. NPDC058505 TaxID=3346531 RepID=UPI0036680541